MPNPNDAKPLSPQDLANQLFDMAITQTKGDPRDAAGHVILFLQEALVYAVVAAAGKDPVERKKVLQSVGASIATAGDPPAAAPPAGTPR